MTDPTAAIEVWARMLCAADVHVHGANHPTWQQLIGEPGRQIRDDYRKAAAWLLPRMTVTVSSAGPAPATDREAVPTDEDFLVAIEEALESTLLPSPGVSVLERTLDAVTGALAPLVAQLRAAVLPAPTDQTAVTCSAQHHRFDDGRLYIRASQHSGDHIDERGYHWSDTVAVYPLADGQFRTGANLRDALRRMAGKAQQDPTQDGEFVPPAALGLPAGTLEAAAIGANRLNAWARTPNGRNFLAHALVQLARDGWLRTEPGEGFEPVRDRDDVPEPQDPTAVARSGQPETDGETQQSEPKPDTPPCAHCTHPKSDHDGRADHREKYSPLVAGEPWCHACNAECDYDDAPADTAQQPKDA